MEFMTDTPAVEKSQQGTRQQYLVPFALITCLFFLWGMAHNLDSILIPHLKKACQLNNRQSTLIDTAVYLAYFLMAIPAGLLLKRFGYKGSIIIGLLLFACGALLFVPAANTLSYTVFLTALFIIGCGLTILETAANPYTTVLGEPEGASFRINFAATFNGMAALVAAGVGTRFILSGKEYTPAQLSAMTSSVRHAYFAGEAAAVKTPYIILATVLILVAVLFRFVNLPEIQSKAKEPSAGSSFFGALRHRHLLLGVIAQFFYVGAQVCVTSFFIRVAKQGGGLDEKTAGYYLAIYGFCFMAGRFIGTIFLKFIAPNKLLAIYAVIATALCVVAILGKGEYVVFALWGLGFFMSIMFPTIFALGIDGLGSDTKPASSWLVMSIIGGAILPYLMATVIDFNHDRIQPGYIIPLVCFLFILYYALNGYRIKKHLIAE
jgi:FHS family L-fucose permease-like MFS transporter